MVYLEIKYLRVRTYVRPSIRLSVSPFEVRFSLLFNGLINQPTFIGYDQLFDCLVGFFEFVRHLYVVHLSLKRLSMRRCRFLLPPQTSYCFHDSDAEYKTSVKLLLKGNFFRYVFLLLLLLLLELCFLLFIIIFG